MVKRSFLALRMDLIIKVFIIAKDEKGKIQFKTKLPQD